MRFINLIFLREKEIVFRKQNLPFQFHNNPKNDDKMITTINKTKQQFKEFYHNIEEIKLTDNEMKKYLVLVYQCAISYLKNKKNKSSLIKKLYRSKVFNTIEVKEINPYLQTKLGQRSNRFLVLGIDEIVHRGDNIEIRQNPKRRRFIQYALNSIEKKDFSSFLLFGPRNSGKTFLVSIYAKKLAELKQNFSVAFINWNQWISIWRLSFNKLENKSSYENEQICKELYEVDFLFFDDFATPRLSEWEKETIFLPIFKYRKQKKLPIGIITNLEKHELLKRIDLNKNKNANETFESFFGNFVVFKL